MHFLDSVTDALTSPKSRPDDSDGAYWCDDCGVRIRDVDLDGDETCPDCGEEMRFERSSGGSCAC